MPDRTKLIIFSIAVAGYQKGYNGKTELPVTRAPQQGDEKNYQGGF